MLYRGWSPSERQRAVVSLGLGLLLVLNPLFVYTLGLGEPTYEYRAVEVTPVGDSVEFETRPHPAYRMQPVRGVDCVRLRGSYSCYLSESLAKRGRATVNVTRYETTPRARYVRLDDGFYRRSATEHGEAVTLSLERVSAATVLDTVSSSFEYVSPPVAAAIEDGTARSHVEEDGAKFVEADGRYYYVAARQVDGGVEGRWWVSSLGVLVGLAALRRGRRIRTSERA
ncbi:MULTISPECIES: hypothetical protein [Haloarcula]|uniref:Uncharacterized protein n=1 Tax=Haloarcula pellucida TaxID=1427151 RepID=A0A830GK72_9EURY|nr:MULTISPECIES: hypothetical protein [Halomicroarcula]MBX0348501.1 hypothetical protein [Halomicroarcula pellucida]MDS0278326.1 hypothetical protein [Halomicroarcula sp. S1AR25-4]GGN93052.1 hypothetical protein GCM10009030_18060 [Halomicroarcula pellucida]